MKITALAGGVGGAKLAAGLQDRLDDGALTVVVNTGDDFTHLGLRICPDLDTVCYTLAGIANLEYGWGRAGETFRALAEIERLGGPAWFRLGDLDLATHLERTRRLNAGEPLSQVCAELCARWGVRARVLPMSDQETPTLVITRAHGELPFQEYFVRLRCEPPVAGFRFDHIETAEAAPGVLDAIHAAHAVVICPSNPWVSIAPILAVPGIRAALDQKIVLAVSPIIAGKAIKGPAAKMYAELGIEPSAQAVAQGYGSLLSGFVLDALDAGQAVALEKAGLKTLVTNTVMSSAAERAQLAAVMLDWLTSEWL